MQTRDDEEIERRVRALSAKGDWQGAATAAIRGYGPEILGLLLSMHRSANEADEVFAAWSENLWKSLPSFDWACTLRTWSYVVANSASRTFARDARAWAQRANPLPKTPELERLQRQIRNETMTTARAEVMDKFAALRKRLTQEDQLLLVLRVDRELEWKDLARVMLEDDGGPIDEASLIKSAQSLRKRFQVLKERLKELGQREGLFSPPSG